MKLKKLLSLVLAGVLAVSVAAVSGVSAQESNPVELTVVTTNDIHGYHTYSQGSVVGLEYVAAIAQAEGADLVLDAGDTLQGFPVLFHRSGNCAVPMQAIEIAALSQDLHYICPVLRFLYL